MLDKNNIVSFWYRFIGAPFRLLPIRRGRILFQNFWGMGYGDNPKYIADALIESNNANLELVWLVKKKGGDIPPEIKQVRRGTLSELYYIATSQVWIDNSRKHLGIHKRKRQFYIQTWHGGIALKKIEKDTEDNLTQTYISTAKKDSKMIDVLLSGSKYFSNIYRNAFWYEGEIWECGLPRTDIFFKQDNCVNEIKAIMDIQKDYKVALYAPTFRENKMEQIYDLNYEKVLRVLEKYWGGKWIIIVRMHPNAIEIQNTIQYTNRILNGSNYKNINDLITISDLLITDYSSCMFDAIYAKKRVLLYASDSNEYMKTRGTYFRLEDLPFLFSSDNEELCNAIIKYDEDYWRKKQEMFLDKIVSCEKGDAAIQVANRINSIVNL